MPRDRNRDDDALSWGDEYDPTYADMSDVDEVPDAAADVPVADAFGGPGAAPATALESPAGTDPANSDAAPADSARTHPAPTVPARTQPASAEPASAELAFAQPAFAEPARAAASPVEPSSARTVEAEADLADDAAAEADLEAAEKESAQLSSAALIAFGILGGILFLYTVGWLVAFLRDPPSPVGLGGIVQTIQAVLTIAAPPLWFIATLLLAAKRRVPVRIIWLVIGIVILVPWPFITGN